MAILTLLWVIAGNAPNADAAIMMGIQFGAAGTLWDINPATAATSNPRNTNISNPIDIAVAPDGRIFSANASTGTSTTLFTINQTTGSTTTVGPTGVGLIEGALAFTPAGVLFGAWTSVGGKNLVTLNTVTGTATVIGPMNGSDDVSALTFGKDGKLYALDSKVNSGGVPALYTLNPATGAILTTINLTGISGVSSTNGMAQDPDTGTFYVAFTGPGNLYTLNVSTGATSLVGSLSTLGTGVSGLAFIPEPAGGVLLACAAFLASAARRHRALRRSTPPRA